ncbi:MAG: TrwC relaxase [uncultured bacterium]|nr:MAG: TrwC relaxase [uncultured bacterium]
MLGSPRSVSRRMLGFYYAKDNYYFDEHQKFEARGKGAENMASVDTTEEGIKTFVQDRDLVAKDLTFSAPKSFGIEWALGNSEVRSSIEKAWDDALNEGISYMEESGLLTYKYKSEGQTKAGEAQGCVFVPVNHQVNREGEPQLHTHLLLLNTGYDKQGVNRALDFQAINRHRKAIGRVVDHAFVRGLVEAGIEVRTRTVESKNGAEENYFECSHIDDKTIDAFSTRRQQVLETADKLREEKGYQNLSDGELNQIAAMSSRKSKKEVDKEASRESWRVTAKAVEYKPLAKLSPRNEHGNEKNTPKTLQLYYEHAKAELTDRKAGFTRLELIEETQKQAAKDNYPTRYNDVNTLINSDRDLLRAGNKVEKFVHETFVSKNFLRMENENMAAMIDGQGKCQSTVMGTTALKHLETYNARLEQEKGYRLDTEQQTAATQILESRDFISAVQGYAGTGKTTLLQAVKDACAEQQREVYGIAPSAKSAHILEQETGIKSSTTDLFCVKNKDKFNQKLCGGLLIMDESSMTGTVKMNEVIKIAKRHGMQVVLTGDRHQLSAVQAGNDFARFQDAGMKTARLENIRRQYDASRPEDQQELLKIGNTIAKDKNIVEAIKQINALASDERDMSAADRRVNVVESPSSRERLRLASKEYVADLAAGRNSIILTDTNARREEYNKEIRYYLKNEGKLDEDERKLTVLNSNGKEVQRGFSMNDRIIFGKNDYKLDVRNNETGTVKGFVQDKDGNAVVLLVQKDDGKTISVDCRKYKAMAHGYALTTHKAQGITVKKAIVDLSSKSYNTFNKEYVALSRHKAQLSVYSDSLSKVAKQGRKREQKLSASEVLKSKEQGQKRNQVKPQPDVKDDQSKAKRKQTNQAKPKRNPLQMEERVQITSTVRSELPGIAQMVSQIRTEIGTEREVRAQAQQQTKIIAARHNLELREKAKEEVKNQQSQEQGQKQTRKLSR